MEELLLKFVGKQVELYCGGTCSLRGEIAKVENGVLHLNDTEHKMCFVAVDKVVVIWDAPDEEHRAGFVSKL